MAISAWRKKPTCQLIAILDFMFAIFMIVLYTLNFTSESQRKLELFRGFIDTSFYWSTYVVIWASIYVFNIMQFLVAYLLFSSLRPMYSDSYLVQCRAHRWLRFSSLIFLLLVIKTLLYLIYIIKFKTMDIITFLVCIIDAVFRIVAVFHVKKFTDELRIQYPVQQPSIHYVNVSIKNPKTVSNV